MAGLLGKEFRHHLGVFTSLGDEVPMSAVGAQNVVYFLQVSDGPGGHRLLTDIQVYTAWNLALGLLT